MTDAVYLYSRGGTKARPRTLIPLRNHDNCRKHRNEEGVQVPALVRIPVRVCEEQLPRSRSLGHQRRVLRVTATFFLVSAWCHLPRALQPVSAFSTSAPLHLYPSSRSRTRTRWSVHSPSPPWLSSSSTDLTTEDSLLGADGVYNIETKEQHRYVPCDQFVLSSFVLWFWVVLLLSPTFCYRLVTILL